MNCKYFKHLLFVSLLILLNYSCEKEFTNPVAVKSEMYPSAPTNLKAQVNDNSIFLTWNAPSANKVIQYRIFRKDTLMERCIIYDSTSNTSYLDKNLRNGMLYTYRISAINAEKYEGPLTNEIYATPGIYSIIINMGAKSTRLNIVTLMIVGLENTKLVQLSNDSSFIYSTWEPFTNERTWELSEGDGLKKVFCQFRDSNGNDNYKPEIGK